MTRISCAMILSIFIGTSALSNDVNQFDRARFKEMRQKVLLTGKVLQKAPKVKVQGDQSNTPFQAMVQNYVESGNSQNEAINKMQQDVAVYSLTQILIEEGFSFSEAQQKANNDYATQIANQGALKVIPFIAMQKDKFRSGGFKGIGFNPIRKVDGTEQKLSQLNIVGRRASDGQVKWFIPSDFKFKKGLKDLPKEGTVIGPQQPWSDDYWAIRNGVLGHRYAGESNFIFGWKNGVNYVLSERGHLSRTLDIEDKEEREEAIDKLSSSEKYDLLIGKVDEETSYWDWISLPQPFEYTKGFPLRGSVGGFLTPDQWQQGQGYYDRDGSVESWMGICHGWATASIQLPRPITTVNTKSATGDRIIFYPADIKALGSYLWAKSAPRSRFIGGRCNDKEAEVDPVSGALKAKNCFDTNPADWHIVVANYLGLNQRSFVMDMTFDYQVWNQPVLSYEYKYFNPYSEGEIVSSLEEAVVPFDQRFKDQDIFKNVRKVKEATKFIVGVYMEVRYLSENKPDQSEFDNPERDAISETYYTYDLELDEDYKPIGGEWHLNEHPDFLWAHDKKQEAYSHVEINNGHNYDSLKDYINLEDGEIHPTIMEWARESANAGEVNGSIIRALFEKSSQVQ